MAPQETTISLDVLVNVLEKVEDVVEKAKGLLENFNKIPTSEEEIISSTDILYGLVTRGDLFFANENEEDYISSPSREIYSLKPSLEKSKFYHVEGEDDFV